MLQKCACTIQIEKRGWHFYQTHCSRREQRCMAKYGENNTYNPQVSPTILSTRLEYSQHFNIKYNNDYLSYAVKSHTVTMRKYLKQICQISWQRINVLQNEYLRIQMPACFLVCCSHFLPNLFSRFTHTLRHPYLHRNSAM